MHQSMVNMQAKALSAFYGQQNALQASSASVTVGGMKVCCTVRSGGMASPMRTTWTLNGARIGADALAKALAPATYWEDEK